MGLFSRVQMAFKTHTENCLYVLTDTMTRKEIELYLTQVITQVDLEIVNRHKDHVPNCKHFTNIPVNNEGKPRQHCFVWVTSKKVFRMLTGCNYDGTKILDNVPASGNTSESTLALPLSNRPALAVFSMDWADEEVVPSRCSRFVIPEHKGFTPTFVAASFNRVTREYREDTLFCQTKLPKDYTMERLVGLFAAFVTQGRITVQRTDKDNALITFDNKDDAYYALCMRKKYHDEEYKLVLSFDHAKRMSKSK